MQIYDQIRRGIIGGLFPPGTGLPSSRGLALDLGVSRSTVITAFDQLMAEGYAYSRKGAGLYVSDVGSFEPTKTTILNPPKPGRTQTTSDLPLTPGHPDDSLFPKRTWAQSVGRAARQSPQSMFRLTDPFGDMALRWEIAKHIHEWRGVVSHPEQILITAGSGEALEIALRLTCKPGEIVGLENPGYHPVRRFTSEYGLIPEWLEIGGNGAQLPSHDARAVVLTPSHQFPLGGTIPRQRRTEFVAQAQQTGCWIIEDDFDSEFRYAGRPIPALSAIDTNDRTIYVGGFSKVFSKDIRIGYLVVPKSLVTTAQDALARQPSRASVVPQPPLALFMESGAYHRHLRKARRHYARRYQLLVASLTEILQGLGHFQRHNTGMQIAYLLPNDWSDKVIAKLAVQNQIGCQALSDYANDRSRYNGLLLGFCATPNDEIRPAILRLQQVLTSGL